MYLEQNEFPFDTVSNFQSSKSQAWLYPFQTFDGQNISLVFDILPQISEINQKV